MVRLRKSLAGVRIDYRKVDELSEICRLLIEANQLKTSMRQLYPDYKGVAERMHRFPGPEIKPAVYIRAFSMPSLLKEMRSGIQVITREDIRWQLCSIKSIALLPNTLLFEEAAKQGAGECIMVRDGLITEATHSNVMAVKKGAMHTHPIRLYTFRHY